MIQVIDDSQWQEWIFRVGCWLLIIGVYLWLLLFIADENEFIGFQSESHHNSALSLSFPVSSPVVNIDKVAQDKIINSAPVNKKNTVETKKILSTKKSMVKKEEVYKDYKILAETKGLDDGLKIKTLEENFKENSKEAQENNKSQDRPQRQNMELTDVSHAQQSQSVEKAIVYKPSLAAPPIPPNYPEVARRKKQQGTVWLDVFLDEEGRQQQLAIYKSSGVSVLDKAAIHAVRQWQFSQYQKNVQAQLVTIRIPIEFSLN